MIKGQDSVLREVEEDLLARCKISERISGYDNFSKNLQYAIGYIIYYTTFALALKEKQIGRFCSSVGRAHHF